MSSFLLYCILFLTLWLLLVFFFKLDVVVVIIIITTIIIVIIINFFCRCDFLLKSEILLTKHSPAHKTYDVTGAEDTK